MNNKNLKFIIIGAVAISLVGLGVCGYLVFHNDKPNTEVENTLPTDTKPTANDKINYAEIKDNNGNDVNGADKKDKVNSDVSIYEANKLIIGNGNKEYPKEKTDSLLSTLKVYASNVDYQKILDEVNPYLHDYRFSLGKNQEIATMYNDASLMLSTKTASDLDKGKIAKAMRNIEMKTVGSLMIPEVSREDLIIDQNSLDPIITGKVQIISDDVLNLNNMDKIKDEDKSIVKDIIENCDKLLSANKLKIKVDKDYTLNVYVITNIDGTVDIYGFYPEKGEKVPYQTVKYWKQTNKELQNQ